MILSLALVLSLSPGIPAPNCMNTKDVCCNGHGCSFETAPVPLPIELTFSPGIPAPRDPPCWNDPGGQQCQERL